MDPVFKKITNIKETERIVFIMRYKILFFKWKCKGWIFISVERSIGEAILMKEQNNAITSTQNNYLFLKFKCKHQQSSAFWEKWKHEM